MNSDSAPVPATVPQAATCPLVLVDAVPASTACPLLHMVPTPLLRAGSVRLTDLEDARLYRRALRVQSRIAVASAFFSTALGLIISAGGWELEEVLRSVLPASAGWSLGSFFVVVVVVAAIPVGTAPPAICVENITPRVIPRRCPGGPGSVALLASRGAGLPVGAARCGQGSVTGTLPVTCTATSRATEEAVEPSVRLQPSPRSCPFPCDVREPTGGRLRRQFHPTARTMGTRLPALLQDAPAAAEASAQALTRRVGRRTTRRMRGSAIRGSMSGGANEVRGLQCGRAGIGRLSDLLLPSTSPGERQCPSPEDINRGRPSRCIGPKPMLRGDVVAAAEIVLRSTYAMAPTTSPGG